MKKDEYRFSIRFNPADPRHQHVVNALQAAGRRKASLIADAVYEYLVRYGEGGNEAVRYYGDGNGVAMPFIPAKTLPPTQIPNEISTGAAGANSFISNADFAALSAEMDAELRETMLDGLRMFDE